MAKRARMSGQMSDAIKNRAVGLTPFGNEGMRKGGTEARVWHGVRGTGAEDMSFPPSKGPAPGRDVRRAKGMTDQAAGKKIGKFQIEDRPKRNRV